MGFLSTPPAWHFLSECEVPTQPSALAALAEDHDESQALSVEKCPVCLHEMENDEGILCDCCEEPIGPGSFAVVNGPGGYSFVYHLRCYDYVYWGEQDDEEEEATE